MTEDPAIEDYCAGAASATAFRSHIATRKSNASWFVISRVCFVQASHRRTTPVRRRGASQCSRRDRPGGADPKMPIGPETCAGITLRRWSYPPSQRIERSHRADDVYVPFPAGRAELAPSGSSCRSTPASSCRTRRSAAFRSCAVRLNHETAALAARENRDGTAAGRKLSHRSPLISSISWTSARRDTSRSLVFARQSEMGRFVPLLEKPQRSAGFAVLAAPDMPSVLVELGCLSNPRG